MTDDPHPRKYYLHDGEAQSGPYLLEDLEQHDLSSTTMVWYKGLADWQEAGTLDELLPVINHTLPHPAEDMPPPFRGPHPRKSTAKSAVPPPVSKPVVTEKRRRAGWSWLAWLFALIVLGGFAVFAVQQYRNATAIMNADETLTYEEQVLSIEDQEKAAPRKFLKASGTYKETVFGGKFKIDGTITNTATVAKFKNVVIEVDYYTDKNKFISAERFTVEDAFPAGVTKDFKLKTDPPKGADNCKWKAVGATAY